MEKLNELALFAGAGGGILGGHLLGWRTVCAVEWEPYPASVLCARQNDKLLPPFPIWDDVQTFDGHPWRGIVHVVSGGFPCQDISSAGKGAGIDGERSGMWREMARIICEVRPLYAFIENSPMLTIRGLDRVLCDLARMGFDARWGVLGAADVGANHQRDRIWIVARQRKQFSHAHDNWTGWGEQQQESFKETPRVLANTINQGLRTCGRGDGGELVGQDRQGSYLQRRGRANVKSAPFGEPQDNQTQVGNPQSAGLSPRPTRQRQGQSWRASIADAQWWETEPPMDRVAHGMVDRVDRLKAIGNGQVPLCAATAWKVLTKNL